MPINRPRRNKNLEILSLDDIAAKLANPETKLHEIQDQPEVAKPAPETNEPVSTESESRKDRLKRLRNRRNQRQEVPEIPKPEPPMISPTSAPSNPKPLQNSPILEITTRAIPSVATSTKLFKPLPTLGHFILGKNPFFDLPHPE